MTVLTKPTEIPRWATDPGAGISTPPEAKKDSGFIIEVPPYQWFNWLHHFQYEWIKYFEDKTDRAPGGSPATEISIAAGVLTPSIGVHFVASETGTADTITNIATDTLNDGSLLLLTPKAGHTITFQSLAGGAGELKLKTGTFVLLPDEYLILNRVGNQWIGVLTFDQNDIDARQSGDTLNIGAANASEINIGRIGAAVKIHGAVTYVFSTELVITDRKVTLNNDGLAGTGGDSGIEIEENNAIVGFNKTSDDRDAWRLKSPAKGESRIRQPDAGTTEGFTTKNEALDNLTIGAGFTHQHANLEIPVSKTYTINGSLLTKDPDVHGDLDVSGDVEDVSEKSEQADGFGGSARPQYWQGGDGTIILPETAVGYTKRGGNIAIGLASNTVANVSSIVLPPGKWEVNGIMSTAFANNNPTVTAISAALTTTSGSLNTVDEAGIFPLVTQTFASVLAQSSPSVSLLPLFVNNSTPTTVYIVGQVAASGIVDYYARYAIKRIG